MDENQKIWKNLLYYDSQLFITFKFLNVFEVVHLSNLHV